MRTRALAALLLPGLLLVGGCGQDGPSRAADAEASASAGTPAPTEVAGPEPQCAEVWVTGDTLPAGYRRCFDGETPVKSVDLYCEFGKPLVTHAGRFWAVRGGEVQEVTTSGRLADDPGYRADLRSCRG